MADELKKLQEQNASAVKLLRNMKEMIDACLKSIIYEIGGDPIYRPIEPFRTELGKGLVSYEAMSDEVIAPGKICNVGFGVKSYRPETGWPGLPQTGYVIFGVTHDFKPENICIEEPFALCGAFVGSQNMVVVEPSMFEIPAEMFADGKTQPDYPQALQGVSIVLQIKNTGTEPLAFHGKIIGKETK